MIVDLYLADRQSAAAPENRARIIEWARQYIDLYGANNGWVKKRVYPVLVDIILAESIA